MSKQRPSKREPYGGRLMPLLFLLWLLALGGRQAAAASFTAMLDRETIGVGETAVLSLIFEGIRPTSQPQVPEVPGLRIDYAGQSSKFTIVNREMSSTVTHEFQITPLQPGEYRIPAIQVRVGNQEFSSHPLTLRVVKAQSPDTRADGQPKPAFVKLVVPKTTAYAGEIFPIEIQVFVTAGKNLQVQQPEGAGFVFGKMSQPIQSWTHVNRVRYNVVTYRLTATAVKAGTLTLGPVQCSLIVYLPQEQRRNRNPFDAFPDPFDIFGPRVLEQPVTLFSDPHSIQVLPLPEEGKPESFNGAIGRFTFEADAGPTNVTVGDPITLRVRISGTGSLDNLAFPPQNGWDGFKTYSPVSNTTIDDALGLSGSKVFEQVIIPQTAKLTKIPSLVFSYFDPEESAYKTLEQPPIPIQVKAGQTLAAHTPGSDGSNGSDDSSDQPKDPEILHIKPRAGTLALLQPPLITRPLFWVLQLLPIAVYLTVWGRRKRQELLARDPRLRRRLQVSGTVRAGLKQLREAAAANDSDTFFATVFRLLQERLGERLDLPASAITEAVLDERLRKEGAPPDLVQDLHALFQLCNQARYAPTRSTQELLAAIPSVESALERLEKFQSGA